MDSVEAWRRRSRKSAEEERGRPVAFDTDQRIQDTGIRKSGNKKTRKRQGVTDEIRGTGNREIGFLGFLDFEMRGNKARKVKEWQVAGTDWKIIVRQM